MLWTAQLFEKKGEMFMTQWRVDQTLRSKYEAAERLGLLQHLQEVGWAGLSAKETGRIGGYLRTMHRNGQENECIQDLQRSTTRS